MIEPIFDRGFIFDSYANRLGKGSDAAVARYEMFRDRSAHVLRGDIYRYFPAIDHAILERGLRRGIACERTLWLADAGDLVHQPPCLGRSDLGADLLPPGDGTQLIELQRRCQRDEAIFETGFKDSAEDAVSPDKGAQQDVGIENRPHRLEGSSPAPVSPKVRTHRRARLVDQELHLLGGRSALRSWMSCTVPLKNSLRTARSMNFDRSPFVPPRSARSERTAMSVSLDTLTVQRVVSALTKLLDLDAGRNAG